MVGDRAHPGRLKPRAGGPNLDAAPPISARWSGTGNQALATLVLTRAAGDTVDSRYGNDLKEYAEMNGANGIAGCRAVTAFGGKLWFQIGPDKTNPLTAGPAEATAESLLAYEKNGGLSGIVLGGSEVTLNGKSFHGPANDFEYVLAQNGSFTATAIHTPIDTVQILPEASAFTKSVDVSFTIPTQDTSDIEYHYTLDGTDPTLQSPLYQGPFSVTQTTMVKVRPFRKELTETPWAVPGVDAGKTIAAIFRKEDSLPAVSADGLKPGLNYHYFEGPWTRLFGYAADDGVLVSRAEGTAGALLDDNQLRKIRKTDRAYAVRYDGYINVPASGVYQFYAPNDLYSCLHDPGYDLRVFIDGKEWFPSPTLHEENKWSVPLDQGAHRFRVAYVDYRWKTFRNEYWMDWQEGEMGQGTPVLNVSGPGIEKESVPSAWLNCLPDSLATGVSKK
jgi:hypothetical protein